jgi:hypothetical protein
MTANFEGKGSEHRFDPDVKCPRCHRVGGYYLGSEVIDANPLTPIADPEVEHFFACAADGCGHEWSEAV